MKDPELTFLRAKRMTNKTHAIYMQWIKELEMKEKWEANEQYRSKFNDEKKENVQS